MDLLKKIADFTMSQAGAFDDCTAPNKETKRWSRWDWSIGVGFYGVLAANELLREDRLITEMDTWVSKRAGDIGKLCVNTCGVMPAVLKLEEKYGKYGHVINMFDDYVMRALPRTPSGAMEHTVLSDDFGGQIWADTLFMCVLYTALRGVQTNDQNMLAEARRQTVLHLEKLVCEDGLYYHGYDDINSLPLGVKWGRGNAWVIVSSIEILRILGDCPEKPYILKCLDKQLSAFEKFQNPNGTWNTVIDAKDTYEEMTVTAGAAYGVLQGIKLGYVDRRFEAMGKHALAALKENAADDGSVLKSSTGTPVKQDALEYNKIPYHVTPFAQGLAILALTAGR